MFDSQIKAKDFEILDKKFNIFQLPLRYTSEIFYYQQSNKMLPYELQIQIAGIGCRLIENGNPIKLDEAKIVELFTSAPFQFQFLLQTIITASFEDDKKKAEVFLQGKKQKLTPELESPTS